MERVCLRVGCDNDISHRRGNAKYCSPYCKDKCFHLNNPEYNKTKHAQYYETKSEHILERKRKYEAKNKDKVKQWNKKSYKNNEQYYKDKSKQYHKDNKEERLIGMKNYYDENKEIIIKNNYERTKQYRNTPQGKLIHNLRRRIHHFLKGNTKSLTTVKMIGCTLDELKVYLEKKFDDKMTWENYGSYWHLDHIIPISFAKDESELIELNHYTNFQPLEARENLSKGARIIN